MPTTRSNTLKDQLFQAFETLSPDNVVRVEVGKMNYTIGGARYAVRAWNKTHPSKQIKYKVEKSNKKEEAIVYLYIDDSDNK
jgi:hypothetical protein